MPDDQTIVEGDAGFLGMASRLNPLQLQAGMVQYCENMRLDRGVAQTRKGAKRLGDGIAAGIEPLVLPFILGDEITGPIIRASYDGGILASGIFSSPNYDNANEWIVLCGPTQAFLYRQGEPLLVKNYPISPDETLEPTDTASCIQAFDRFYLLREADPTLPGWETKYTNSTGITVSGTTATVNLTAHGYTAGMRVRIEGGAAAAFQGHEFDILGGLDAPTTNAFKITVNSGTPPSASAGIAIRRVKPPLYWDGQATTHFVRAQAGTPTNASFKRMRSTGWASYINNRLVLPDGRDAVTLSDVLDPDLYDPFWQNFRANAGSNDYLVAVHPWVDGSVLVFMRKSIYLAEVNQAYDATGDNTLISSITLLTNEIGCVARRSIQTAGNFVFFLSDAGVYRLDTKLDLKLRGDTLPLSDPIADQFEQINAATAHRSVGLWFNNRYMLAVPIGPAATANNTLFLWNALNQQWESRDAYSFFLDELLVSDYDNQRRVFAASQTGNLFLLDEMERGDDIPESNISDEFTPVAATLRTRRYGWGSLNTKRLTRSKASVLLPADSSCELRAITTDYDADFQIATLSNTLAEEEDYTLKAPLRCKAVGLDLQFSTLTGRPILRQITGEATRSALDPTETRTLN
jgi:hypothetical protein